MTLGIDAGTTRFKSAILTTSGEPQTLTNRMGQTFTPSVVYFNEDGSTLIGTEAANAALASPKRAVFDWKANMGTDKVLYADNGVNYTAKDILAILLENIKIDAEAKTGEPINHATITVPANYSNVQKQQTCEAAKKAGINVLLTPHEPTAGALGNHIYKFKGATTLVYDLGGGTFDVSIIKITGNVCEVIATGGVQMLGGRDFNNCIKNSILDEFESQHGYRPDPDNEVIFYQDLYDRIEQLKISLSSQLQCNLVLVCNGDVLSMTVTREQFEELVVDLVSQTLEQTECTLKDANLEWADIDAIYPIGGGSMMPIVARSLEEASGKKVNQNCEAHCAVALGAAVAGRLECEKRGDSCTVGAVTLPPIGHYLREILSCAMGVSVIDEDERDICFEILGKDTPFPSTQTQNFRLSELGQTTARIQFLQGKEGARANDCIALGHFDLEDLPESDIVSRIEITFKLDSNGILTAKARDNVSGKTSEMKIDYDITINNTDAA